MGYDLHITRADDWAESEAIPITHDEWEALVAADPELRHGDGSLNDQSLVIWDTNEGCLWWDEGQIISKHPDEALVTKMAALAQELGATVQGDDGEQYPLDENESARSKSGCLLLVGTLLLVVTATVSAIG